MADEEHLRLLAGGVAAWNSWRAEHPEAWPDLEEADLGWANLDGADLRRANLRRADLSEASLAGACLEGAALAGSYLREADFSEADLTGADLSEAELRDASFRGARLAGANLAGASMTEVDLEGADLSRADLRGVDLTRATLEGAVLREARLAGADLRCESLAARDFTGADLTGISLHSRDASRLGRWALELLQANGIESAAFTSLKILSDLAEAAFRQAHRAAGEDLARIREAARAIRVLRETYGGEDAGAAAWSATCSGAQPLRVETADLAASAIAEQGWRVELECPASGGTTLFGVSRPGGDPSVLLLEHSRGPTGPEMAIVRGLYELATEDRETVTLFAMTSPAPGPGAYRPSRCEMEARAYRQALEWLSRP